MKIAVLSGKGGAGKTMVAVNLAVSIQADTYIDCDVEEPNGRIFLRSEQPAEVPVNVRLPEFDSSKCNGCKSCVEFCRFHALMYVKEKPMVFAEVCHSCGGCVMVCPAGAVTERDKQIGVLEIGRYQGIRVVSGCMNPGEPSGVPIVREALSKADGVTVIDCPPGSACLTMESVAGADVCLLVAEANAFGFHNFKMVHELAVLLGKSCYVVINKVDKPYEPLEKYCEENNLPVVARIGYDAELAKAASQGEIYCEMNTEMNAVFRSIYQQMGGVL